MTGLFGDPTTPEAPVALLFFSLLPTVWVVVSTCQRTPSINFDAAKIAFDWFRGNSSCNTFPKKFSKKLMCAEYQTVTKQKSEPSRIRKSPLLV